MENNSEKVEKVVNNSTNAEEVKKEDASKALSEETSNEENSNEENSSSEGEENSEKKEDGKDKKMKTSDKVFFAVMGSIVIILAIHLILFTFVFFHVQVSGRSMENTLSNQDILIANKNKTPEFGDVIIISGLKDTGEWLVKRAIAFEGDIVTISSGNVYLNGELLEEDYVVGKTYAPDSRDSDDIYEINYVIGEGEIFFLGDNREDSLDSRHYGVCTFDNIEGVVGNGAIKIKGITTSINTFILKVKSKLGFKTGIVRG